MGRPNCTEAVASLPIPRDSKEGAELRGSNICVGDAGDKDKAEGVLASRGLRCNRNPSRWFARSLQALTQSGGYQG